jgi:excinuclease UvrABC nuclease subunit
MKKIRIAMSERCFRFKPDALPSHAPHKPGVYEFVMFDANKQPQVLFVGLAMDKPIYQALDDHWNDKLQPGRKELFGVSPDVYFDYVASADIADIEELKDIAGSFIAKHKPRFNTGPVPSSGKHDAVEVEEVG